MSSSQNQANLPAKNSRDRAKKLVLGLQDEICVGLETIDGEGKFLEESYCYPEQNYLTKRFSGKWTFIEFAFQSWSLDPCNSFGIHMAGFNPKPWFKQPCGLSIKTYKKYNYHIFFEYCKKEKMVKTQVKNKL